MIQFIKRISLNFNHAYFLGPSARNNSRSVKPIYYNGYDDINNRGKAIETALTGLQNCLNYEMQIIKTITALLISFKINHNICLMCLLILTFGISTLNAQSVTGINSKIIREVTMNDPSDSVSSNPTTVFSSTANMRVFMEGTARTFNPQDSTFGWRLPEKNIDTSRFSNASLRFETPKRDTLIPYANLGGQNYRKDRQEVRFIENINYTYYNETNIYSGFSLYIPSETGIVSGPTDVNSSPWNFIHQTFISGSLGNIPVVLNLLSGHKSRLTCGIRYHFPNENEKSLNASGFNIINDYYDIPLDQWIDIVLKYRLGENGSLALYTKVAGEAPQLRFTYNGPISRMGTEQDVLNSEFRYNLGIYKALNYNDGQIRFIDEMRIGKCINSILPWKDESNWRFITDGDSQTIVLDTFDNVLLCPKHETFTDNEINLTHPVDGLVDIDLDITFEWDKIDFASVYEVYLWENGQIKPTTPTVKVFEENWSTFYNDRLFPQNLSLDYNKTYNWQVIAKNEVSVLESDTNTFTTNVNSTGVFIDKGEYRWDIGSAYSPVEVGWERLAYNAQQGYVKWTQQPNNIHPIYTTNQSINNMQRDYIYSGDNSPLELSHQLSNGLWKVTIHFAGTGQANIHVYAEDTRELEYISAPSFISHSFQTAVTDSVLELRFDDTNSTNNIYISGIELKILCSSDSIDNDNDGICDFADVCPGFDDNLSQDSDFDGICDFIDICPNDSDNDIDQDGVCGNFDICPNFDDSLIGSNCDDNNPCTENDIYNSNCECIGSLISAPVPAPQNLAISNPQANSAIISWDSDSDNYELQYKPSSSANWMTIVTSLNFVIANELDICTTYDFRVRSILGDDCMSVYTESMNASTTGCTVCTAPSGLYQFNVQNNSAIITWDVLVGASAYTYKFRKVGEPNWISQTTPFPIAVLFGIDSCTNYEWTMEVICDDGTVAQSNTINTLSTLCKNGNITASNPSKIIVYPNPSHEFISISGIPEVHIIIYNSLGIEILNTTYFSGETISIKSWAEGIYFIRLKDETNRWQNSELIKI